MTLPRLQLTETGSLELAKGGEVIITRVGFGDTFTDYAGIRKATRLNKEFDTKAPTLGTEGGFRTIEVVFDNQKITSPYVSLKEIGVFAKIGNGAEFLLYYGADNKGVDLPDKGNQSYTLRLKFKVKVTAGTELTVQTANNLAGLATATAVNEVSNKLAKLKTGSVGELEGVLNIVNLRALFGKTTTPAPADINTLGTPGVYQYTRDLGPVGIPSSYGFILVFSNQVGNLGQNGNWTWQIVVGTNGRMWLRKRINTDAWITDNIASGNQLIAVLRRLGMDEWAINPAPVTCPAGTNFGNFLKTDAVPKGFSIVKDSNAPAKEVYVYKASNTYAYCFAPMQYGDFFIGSLENGNWRPWANLAQAMKAYTSNTDDFGAYLQSDAVPIGLSAHKDRKTGAFGQVTKFDNNNVYFNGTMRKGGKTYQVVYSIVDGVKPAGFTEWALN